MAHFRGEVQGHRGVASRLGTKNSGLWANLGGWHVGVRVYCRHNVATGKDVLDIYATNGTKRNKRRRVATIHEDHYEVYPSPETKVHEVGCGWCGKRNCSGECD